MGVQGLALLSGWSARWVECGKPLCPDPISLEEAQGGMADFREKRSGEAPTCSGPGPHKTLVCPCSPHTHCFCLVPP